MRAALLTVGDELLIGQIVDSNAAWIAAHLEEHGVRLVRKVTVGDEVAAVAQALKQLAADAEVVLITGGLGPTDDDRTLEALALAAGVEQIFDEAVYARIRHIFEEIIRRPLSPSHRRQAMLPAGAEALRNSQGTAPGVWLELADGGVVAAMPGVPREMKALMREEIVPRLLARGGQRVRTQLTLLTAGHGETQIADAIAEVERELVADGGGVAYLPSLGTVRLRLTAEGAEGAARVAAAARAIRDALPPGSVFGEGELSLAAALLGALVERGATVATAESCTAGQVARRLCAEPGASRAFVGGVVAYADELKTGLLGVDPDLIRTHGAVSREVATAMAAGARERLGADYAASTTGIAGPGGARPGKPVGTVWIAVADADGVAARKLTLGRDRNTNIDYSANAALNLLRLRVLGLAARDA